MSRPPRRSPRLHHNNNTNSTHSDTSDAGSNSLEVDSLSHGRAGAGGPGASANSSGAASAFAPVSPVFPDGSESVSASPSSAASASPISPARAGTSTRQPPKKKQRRGGAGTSPSKRTTRAAAAAASQHQRPQRGKTRRGSVPEHRPRTRSQAAVLPVASPEWADEETYHDGRRQGGDGDVDMTQPQQAAQPQMMDIETIARISSLEAPPGAEQQEQQEQPAPSSAAASPVTPARPKKKRRQQGSDSRKQSARRKRRRSSLGNAQDQEGGSSSRDSSGKDKVLRVRLLFDMRVAGFLIGSKGTVIKHLEQQSGAVLSSPKPPLAANERILSVSGHAPEVKAAMHLIGLKVQEIFRAHPELFHDNPFNQNLASASTLSSPAGSGKSASGKQGGDAGGDAQLATTTVILTMLVPHTQVGILIGTGGSEITAIRHSSGATIKIGDEMLPGSSEKPVVVQGPPDRVHAAIERMLDVLQRAPHRKGQPTIQYAPQPAGVPQFMMVNYSAAANAGILPQGPASLGLSLPPPEPVAALPQSAPSSVSSTGSTPSGSGSLASAAAAAARSQRRSGSSSNLLTSANPPALPASSLQFAQNLPLPAWSPEGTPSLRVIAVPSTPSDSDAAPGVRTVELAIPEEMVGALIGKRGGTITEIRRKSGASIKIGKKRRHNKSRSSNKRKRAGSDANDSDSDGGSDGSQAGSTDGRPMTITGPESAIQTALQLVYTTMADYTPHRRA